MELASSRRILMLGAPNSGVLTLLEDLTGSAPTPNIDGSTAGLGHVWDAKTRYYTARVPIWIDEITDANTWQTDFSRPEAHEVVDVVGAWVYCFRETAGEAELAHALEAIDAVLREHGCGEDDNDSTDVIRLAVAMGSQASSSGPVACNDPATREAFEDICLEHGFELVRHSAIDKDLLDESQGIERVREALEANVWSASADVDDDLVVGEFVSDMDAGDANDESGIARQEAEWTSELFDLKASLTSSSDDPDAEALHSDDEAARVDDLDRILGQLTLVKEQTAHLPEAERKRIAAKAVMDIVGKLERS